MPPAATPHDDAQPHLMLHEEILLLALDDEEGTIPFGSMFQYGMAGGIATELVLRRHIALEQVKKSMLVDVVPDTHASDPLLDDVLERMRTTKRRASLQTWVGRIAQTKKLRERVAATLCERGVLRSDEGRVLLLFRRQTWPTEDPATEFDVVRRIHDAIRGNGVVDPRTATLIALARPCGLLKLHVDKAELKARSDRIDAIVDGNRAGDAAKAAIDAISAALIATSIATTAATT